MPSAAHDNVVSEILVQLHGGCSRKVWVGGRTIEMEIPGTQRHIVREVDIAFRPRVSTDGERPSAPRLIVEVEAGMRSIHCMQKAYCQYFQLMPMLRALLLVKVFRRTAMDFALLMMLYRRDVDGSVLRVDAVSFGSAGLPPGTKDYLEGVADLRTLPIVPPTLSTRVPSSHG